MNIGIIDADLLGRDKHRFPNLACEKISGYWKEKGHNVHLLLENNNLNHYDLIYVSKVFTDTLLPEWLTQYINNHRDKVNIGGTGFYFDDAPNLPDEIEHHMPDYHLYDEWIDKEMKRIEYECKRKQKKFSYSYYIKQFNGYLDYSIGFLTRGCFRKCKFCVNQKYDYVFLHSPLKEFYDPSRKKICLLDDNFFGYGRGWEHILKELIDTKKTI